MLKSRVTQKDIQNLASLIKEKGYWSEEVTEFNSQFTYYAMCKLQDKAKTILR
jgi:hypothetical protein